MWVPVIESKDVTDGLMAVSYLGEQVVLFKQCDGTLAALHDQCPHRGVPLSLGKLVDGTVQCGFHHFCYSGSGENVKKPIYFQEQDLKLNAKAFRVLVSAGLVWITVDPNDALPSPTLFHSTHQNQWKTSRLTLDGDYRSWLDHFLDVSHCLFTHLNTTFLGMHQQDVGINSFNININSGDIYPIENAVSFNFKGSGSYAPIKISAWSRLVSAYIFWRKLVNLRKKKKPMQVEAQLNLLTPFCQETVAKFFGRQTSIITSITPISQTQCELFIAIYMDDGNNLMRSSLVDHVKYHLGIEDSKYLSKSKFLQTGEMGDFELDKTVFTMRSIFEKNYGLIKDFLAPNSILHKMPYGNESYANLDIQPVIPLKLIQSTLYRRAVEHTV